MMKFSIMKAKVIIGDPIEQEVSKGVCPMGRIFYCDVP
jgi:hypothetical protein